MVIGNEHIAQRQQNMQLYRYSVSEDGLDHLIHEAERSPNVYKGHLVRAASDLDPITRDRIQSLLESLTSTPMRYLRFRMGYHIFQEDTEA